MKTRSLAQGLIAAGNVRLNRIKMSKPGHDIVAGDVLTVSVGARVLVLKVVGFSERRGPFSEARLLYEDLSALNSVPAQKGDA